MNDVWLVRGLASSVVFCFSQASAATAPTGLNNLSDAISPPDVPLLKKKKKK